MKLICGNRVTAKYSFLDMMSGYFDVIVYLEFAFDLYMEWMIGDIQC